MINYGQAEIAAFTQAVASKEITYEPGVAKEAAATYDDLISDLVHQRLAADRLTKVSGFGGFQSAKELEAGFSRKAQEAVLAIDGLIQGCMQMQENYLRAGGLIEAADAKNAQVLKRAGIVQQDTQTPAGGDLT